MDSCKHNHGKNVAGADDEEAHGLSKAEGRNLAIRACDVAVLRVEHLSDFAIIDLTL